VTPVAIESLTLARMRQRAMLPDAAIDTLSEGLAHLAALAHDAHAALDYGPGPVARLCRSLAEAQHHLIEARDLGEVLRSWHRRVDVHQATIRALEPCPECSREPRSFWCRACGRELVESLT